MGKYDASVRPVENSSQPLVVTFGVSLHHVIDVVEKDQLLTTNCWITQIWMDHHLRWNTSDFNGISVIRLPHQRVWKPDIILYNNADPNYSSAVINTNVIVKHTGEVTWLSHGIYVSVCDINVEQFPFDIQVCTMKWASWTYDGYQLDLQKQFDEGDTTNYQTNGEFDLVSFEAIKNNQHYSCCDEPYPDITYVIKLRRRPMFYVFNLILPCLLINGIGLYYGVSTCLVSFSASLSVVTLNISYRQADNILVGGLPVNPRTGSRLKSEINCDGSAPQTSPRFSRHNTNHINRGKQTPTSGTPTGPVETLAVGCFGACSRCVCCGCTLRDAATRHEHRVAANERLERANLEWKQVAVVADRALLAVFVLITTMATGAILLPQFKNLHVGNTPLKSPI
ncbi:unnamed protein product [Leptidea sinapis]|uniref:Neurotransmitter-gated ion-channel ligand-binding domain-containing protein n=1 Tax=Leptidea sinapis TaxID=189913 RepID=A0A5E4QB89_9NEOP|nr:unnamed protein product [Leptidea sinapis]